MRAVLVCLALLLLPHRAAAERNPAPTPRATIYAFFATWCVPCRLELPRIEQLAMAYRERGLEVVLVSEDAPSTAEQIPAFLARLGVRSRWVLDDESALLERYNSAANVPFVVVLDSGGRVTYSHAGYEPGDEVELERAVVGTLDRTDVGTEPSHQRVRTDSSALGIWRTSRFDPAVMDERRVGALATRLEVFATPWERRDDLQAAVRVDGSLLDDGVSGADADARLERVSIGDRFGPVRVRLGDGYAAFGSGVSLSLRRVDALGIDTSLRGGRVDIDVGAGRVTALAGVTNPQAFDVIELRQGDETRDLITGVQTELPIGIGTLGPYALFVAADGAAADGGDLDWTLGGVAGRIRVMGVGLSADLAAGQRHGATLDGSETAYAGYVAAQRQAGPITVLADAKLYRHWQIGRAADELLYHEPPTLEREDQEVPGNEDAVGARVRVDWRVRERETSGTTLIANAMAYRFSLDGSDPIDGGTAAHGYAGVEHRFEERSVAAWSGYRRETESDGAARLSLWHADLDVATPLPRGAALTLKWNHREETKMTFREQRFRRGLLVLGTAWRSRGTLSLLYGYSTEAASAPTHYPGAELLLQLPRGSQLRLFGGRLTGGRVCVSGSCRDVPPFEGARLDLMVRL